MENTLQNSPEIVVLTGMSGSGRSVALKTLEDMGYEAIDNLPLYLLEAVCSTSRPDNQPLAIGVDVRSHGFSALKLDAMLEGLRQKGGFQLFFLDADDTTLELRFQETRRRHPLANDKPILEGIRLERTLLQPLKDAADQLVDTSHFSTSDLKKHMRDTLFHHESGDLLMLVNSFAYPRGIPREADQLYDMRFLENPHYDPVLSPLTGQDPAVQAFIRKDNAWSPFEEHIKSILSLTLPRYQKEGRKYIHLSFGCTGGKHRSVFAAETFAKWLEEDFGKTVKLTHRELERGLK